MTTLKGISNMPPKIKAAMLQTIVIGLDSLAIALSNWIGVAAGIIGLVSGIFVARYYYYKSSNEKFDLESHKKGGPE